MADTQDPGRLKRGLGYLLLLVALGALAAGWLRESGASTSATEPAGPSAHAEATTVYYFHGNQRCKTCNKIEAETKRVVTSRFAPELASGDLLLEIVNFDLPENLHYRDDFDLAFGTVLVAGKGEDPPWENLGAVWDHVDAEPPAFEDYLVQNVRSMLERAP